MNLHHLSIPSVLIVALALLAPLPARAATALAWGDVLGWVSFAPGARSISVTDTRVSGYAWSSTYGWLNLSPEHGGVTNTPEGALGGYAWSPALGWIPFAGASITGAGVFTGTAGQADLPAGRLSFDCARCRITTDWRPASVREVPPGASVAPLAQGAARSSRTPASPRALPPLPSVYAFSHEPLAAPGTHPALVQAYDRGGQTSAAYPHVEMLPASGEAEGSAALSDSSASSAPTSVPYVLLWLIAPTLVALWLAACLLRRLTHRSS